jgi:HAD superfamily hydrolase (TIGR01509 family)
MGKTLIDTIVFDIGWVLVRFNYQPIIDLLRARGCAVDDLHAVLERAALAEHESGRLHGHGLLERLAGLTSAPVTHEELHQSWVGMFELDAPMLDLAHRLSEHHKVYLLSNIGDLHWGHLSREYRFHALGHGALPSYLAGAMKPHADIYAEAERRFGLTPAATVFIDDRADNIAAARERGWAGIVHTDHRSTRAALRGMGVGC